MCKEFLVHSFMLNTNKLQNYLQVKSSELYSSMFYFLLAWKRKLIELFMVLIGIYIDAYTFNSYAYIYIYAHTYSCMYIHICIYVHGEFKICKLVHFGKEHLKCQCPKGILIIFMKLRNWVAWKQVRLSDKQI